MAQVARFGSGRACRLCPGSSDVNFFRYGEGIIDLDTEVPDSAFDLGMTEQELHGSQITSTSVDQGCLGRRSEWVPKRCGSRPMHSETSRAYCLVVILLSEPRRPVNINSPGFLVAVLR